MSLSTPWSDIRARYVKQDHTPQAADPPVLILVALETQRLHYSTITLRRRTRRLTATLTLSIGARTLDQVRRHCASFEASKADPEAAKIIGPEGH